MNIGDCISFCRSEWSEGGSALEGLKEFIKVPNLSPSYDTSYRSNGLVDRAVDIIREWALDQGVIGISSRVFCDPGRDPLLYFEIDSPSNNNILIYGHLDKMPHLDLSLWKKCPNPTAPIVVDGKIYGRGSSDDGYSPFCAITALKFLQLSKLQFPKITILLETGEESFSHDIDYYLSEVKKSINYPKAVLILDGEAQSYDTVWSCRSLRGICVGDLEVRGGDSAFRIARSAISRIEDEETGEMKIAEAHTGIPPSYIDQCRNVASKIGLSSLIKLIPGARLLNESHSDGLVRRGWSSGMEITGLDFYSIEWIKMRLSVRIPPGCDTGAVGAALKRELERDAPNGYRVGFNVVQLGPSWDGGEMNPKVDESFKKAVSDTFGAKPAEYGEGGSISICSLFAKEFSYSSIMVIGCTGIDSNAHGYDESLDLNYIARFTAMLSEFLNLLSN